jgi:4-hydroxy-tetrahydrodipicolinate reductase
MIGFGKTGKAVAATILRERGLRLEWVVRRSELLDHRSIPEFLGEPSDDPGIIHSSRKIGIKELLDQQPVDVIVDFSSESGIEYYGEEAVARGITIASGVSHYAEETQKLLKRYSKSTVVFWSPNITLGINYLIIAAKYLKKIAPHVDFEIVEEHFKEKPGVSGTAKIITKNLGLRSDQIKSVRAGGIIGRHEIICGFPYQTVRLVHESITREAFGNGMIFVVNNLDNKEPGFYDFEDLLLPYFGT